MSVRHRRGGPDSRAGPRIARAAHRPRAAAARAPGPRRAAPARSPGDGRERREPLFGLVSADLARVAECGEPRDLALAFDAGGVVLGKAADEPRDAVADLQREVGGGG